MKVAVCVSGIARGSVQKNMDLIQNAFGDVDFFFATWKGKEKDLEKYGITDYKTFDEPFIDYHPLADVPEDIMPPVMKTWSLRERIKTDFVLRERMQHQSKQILGHSLLLKSIPKKYDMIIRARYDTLVSDKADLKHWLNLSYKEKRAIGFGTRTSRWNKLHELYVLPHVWPDRYQPSPGVSNDWGGYIMDPLILHPRKLFDHKRCWNLHNKKSLLAAERGFYQILSQPYGDTHESIYGGAQIEKYLKDTVH